MAQPRRARRPPPHPPPCQPPPTRAAPPRRTSQVRRRPTRSIGDGADALRPLYAGGFTRHDRWGGARLRGLLPPHRSGEVASSGPPGGSPARSTGGVGARPPRGAGHDGPVPGGGGAGRAPAGATARRRHGQRPRGGRGTLPYRTRGGRRGSGRGGHRIGRPVAFVAFVALVALVAAPIARRLVNAPLTLVPAALSGAVLVLVADLVGRRGFTPTALPVGIITGVIGTAYLLGSWPGPTGSDGGLRHDRPRTGSNTGLRARVPVRVEPRTPRARRGGCSPTPTQLDSTAPGGQARLPG